MGRVVDCAIYEGGQRLSSLDINDADQMRVQPGRVIWIGLYEPGQEELAQLQRYFGLHELAVEDAYRAHQRPKLELYGETMFVVMKTSQMDGNHVAMGETSFFIGRGYVITVRHGPSVSYADVRSRCEHSPENFKKGEDFILYALMDFIVDRYFPIVDSIEDDIERLEEAVLDGRSTMDVLEEITVLRRDLLHMRHAVAPLPETLATITFVERRKVMPCFSRMRWNERATSPSLSFSRMAGLTRTSSPKTASICSFVT